MKQYDEFRDIKLEDTGIMYNKPASMVALKRLLQNNITNVAELFERYDEGSIDYGFSSGVFNLYDLEVKANVELLRYKYLKKDLDFNPLLNLSDFSIGTYDGKKKFYKELIKIGIPSGAVVQCYNYMIDDYKKQIRIIDILYLLKKYLVYTSQNYYFLQDCLNEKVRLLLEYSDKYFCSEGRVPGNIRSIRKEKQRSLEETFLSVDWSEYNDAVYLENDEDFNNYIRLKNKIKVLSKR